MRIARPITPRPTLPADRMTSLRDLSALSREIQRAQNEADVLMARNLRRSRALARQGGAR